MSDEKVPPVHPGEILLEEYLKPLGLSQHRLALCLGVDPRRVNTIVQGKRAVAADTAWRPARFFGTSPALWLNLQMWCDLDLAQEALGRRIEQEVRPRGLQPAPA